MLRRTLYNSLSSNILTDVSILSAPKGLEIDRFYNVIHNHSPNYMDIGLEGTGSKMNPRLSYPFVKKVLGNHPSIRGVYVLNPKEPQHYPMISFKTSISSIFMKKMENTTVKEMTDTFKTLDSFPDSYKKLYVTCLNECPYAGPIDLDIALHKICKFYHTYNFDEISLCDTCATLTYEDLSYLMVSLVVLGIPKSKIALQLGLNKHSEMNVQFAHKYGIRKWDVVGDDFGSLRGVLTYNMFRKWI